MNELEEVQSKQIVDVYPISKGKRLLLFLADYFIVFILSFLLFNVAVVPLGNIFTSYKQKQDSALVHQNNKINLLQAYDILLFEDENSKENLNACLTYTSKCFISYYCFEEENPLHVINSSFGHKSINESLYHAYKSVLMDETKYYDDFSSLNARNEYFDVTSTSISLKSDIVTEIKGYFIEGDEISTNGRAIIENITVYIFMNLFNNITDYVIKNDLTYDNGNEILSYKQSHLATSIFKDEEVLTFSMEAIVGVIISWLICFIIIPLFNSSTKTLGMVILKCGKINSRHLKSYSKKELLLGSIYNLIATLSISFFLPMSILGSSFPFASQILSTTILLSLIFSLVSFVITLFNENSRSLSDICSFSVVLLDEDLDKIYSSVGKI